MDADGDGGPDTWYRDDDGDGVNDLLIGLGPGGALAINDAGQIVGAVENRSFLITPEDTDGDQVPDRWFRDLDGDGKNDLSAELGAIQGQSNNWPSDINNAGQIVGDEESRKFGRVPFFWENGNIVNLDDLTDSDTRASLPNAINDAGQIVTRGDYILLPIEPTP